MWATLAIGPIYWAISATAPFEGPENAFLDYWFQIMVFKHTVPHGTIVQSTPPSSPKVVVSTKCINSQGTPTLVWL